MSDISIIAEFRAKPKILSFSDCPLKISLSGSWRIDIADAWSTTDPFVVCQLQVLFKVFKQKALNPSKKYTVGDLSCKVSGSELIVGAISFSKSDVAISLELLAIFERWHQGGFGRPITARDNKG